MEKRKWDRTPGALACEGLRPFPGFYFLFSIFLLSVLGGCAAPAEPVERKPKVPAAVTDLAARQSGNDVILTFTLPTETLDRRPLKQSPAIEIYRGIEQTRSKGPAPLLVTIPSAMVSRYTEHNHVRYVDSLNAADFASLPFIGAVYTIRTRVSEKRGSADSNAAELVLFPAPDAIEDLKAEITHSGVVLKWTPPQKSLTGSVPPIAGYHIYRAEAIPTAQAEATPGNLKLKAPLTQIGSAVSAEYSDAQAEFDHTYVYSVRSAAQYSDESLESKDSNSVIVTPRDTFPPAVPQGLVVVMIPAQGGVPANLDLSWAISPETDIAGYNVFRSEQEAARGERLNVELLRTPSYRDMSVMPGRRYSYSVTAVDRSGNESPASAAVSAGISVESQTTP